MKFNRYLTETKDRYGAGITFVDIDDTVFRTFAKVLVKKDGKVVLELDNQEFNSYVLKDGESFDFDQFKNAELFNKTSIPIPQTISRVKKMLDQIKSQDSGSKIVFLTARSDFDDKKTFLDTFEKHGISMDKPNVFVERSGNIKGGTVESRKKKVMFDYIKTGQYRRVRLIDDHIPNLKALKEIENNLPKEIEDKVIRIHNIDINKEKLPLISFYTLHVQADGSMRLI